MKKILNLFFFALVLCTGFNYALAQSDQDAEIVEEEKYELPKSGRLAGTVSGGLGNLDTIGPWTGKAKDKSADTAGKTPITASINRSGDRWILRVNNKSEDQYTVSIKVTQSDSSGRSVRTNPVTMSLRAGQSLERSFLSSPRTASAVADLVKWTVRKKPGAEKDAEEEAQEVQEGEASAKPADATKLGGLSTVN